MLTPKEGDYLFLSCSEQMVHEYYNKVIDNHEYI
jgi:hypothetical protein